MSEASRSEPTVAVTAIAWLAETFGVTAEPDRIPAMAAYLDDIRAAFHALAHLDPGSADFPASFDPSWDEPDR